MAKPNREYVYCCGGLFNLFINRAAFNLRNNRERINESFKMSVVHLTHDGMVII